MKLGQGEHETENHKTRHRSDINILMIFWHKSKIDNFDPYNVLYVGYCYKYTCATYDWFCGPGSYMILHQYWLTVL